jgi:hypothetical protein
MGDVSCSGRGGCHFDGGHYGYGYEPTDFLFLQVCWQQLGWLRRNRLQLADLYLL